MRVRVVRPVKADPGAGGTTKRSATSSDAPFTCSSQHANAPVILTRLHGCMTGPAPASGHGASPLALLTAQERAVYDVLARHAGTVVSRAAIASEAGMADL